MNRHVKGLVAESDFLPLKHLHSLSRNGIVKQQWNYLNFLNKALKDLWESAQILTYN